MPRTIKRFSGFLAHPGSLMMSPTVEYSRPASFSNASRVSFCNFKHFPDWNHRQKTNDKYFVTSVQLVTVCMP